MLILLNYHKYVSTFHQQDTNIARARTTCQETPNRRARMLTYLIEVTGYGHSLLIIDT